VRSPDVFRTGFGKAEKADFSLLDEVSDSADRILNRYTGVDVPWLIDVDHIDTQRLKRVGGKIGLVLRKVQSAELFEMPSPSMPW
jgi:hypothetical protein